jgi:putative ABC transport system permease protein
MALVGMLTAIDVLKQSISENFAVLGTNTFVIRNRGANIKIGRKRKMEAPHKVISYNEALEFQKRYFFPSKISISAFVTPTGIIKHGSEKTYPNVSISAGDENYLSTAGYEIQDGRNFTKAEIASGSDVIILGREICEKIFKPNEIWLDKQVFVGSRKFTVIGILKEAGSGLNMGRDRTAIIPVSNYRNHYATSSSSYTLNVNVSQPGQMDAAVGEAIGIFRGIRKVDLSKSENFEVVRSDNLINSVLDMTSYISMGAILIGLITMFGAVVGLVNIMLVAVNERTREIGVRKAIGATKTSIAMQFLTEAIVICQLGGLFGIIFGMLVGNSMTIFLGGSFIVPWNWIALSVFVCFATGISAGVYPALKASRLDPIEALRYE